jgi:hypothetical protein
MSLTAKEKNQSNDTSDPSKEQQLHQAAPVYEKVYRFGQTRVKPVLAAFLPRGDDLVTVEEDKAELEEEEIEGGKQQDSTDKIDLKANMLDGGTKVEDSEATQTQKEEEEEDEDKQQQQQQQQQQQEQVEQKLKSNTKEMKMFQRRSSSIRPISIDKIDKSNLQKKKYATTIGVDGSVTLAAAAAAAGAAAAAAQVASSVEKQAKKIEIEEKEKVTAAPVDGTTKKISTVTKAATPKTVSKPSSSGKKRNLIAEQPPQEEQQPAAPTNGPALASDTVVINGNKVYGCSKCRFNARGCARCRTDGTKPPPRGKKYKLFLAQQAAAAAAAGGDGGDGAATVPAAAAKEKKDKGLVKPSRRRVVPEIISQPPLQQEQKAVQVEEEKEKEVAVVEKEEEAPKVQKLRRQSTPPPKTAGEGNIKAKNIPLPEMAPPVVVDDDDEQQQQQSVSQPTPMASSPSFPKVEGVPEQVLKEMIKGKWRKNGKCGLCVNCLKPTAKRGCMAQRALRDVGLLAHTAKSLAGASKRRNVDHDHYGGNGGGSVPSSKKGNGGNKRRKVDGGDGGDNEVVDKDGWTVTQVEALQRAWVEISPTVPNFWALIAKRVRGKSASECFAKHFSRHPTLRHKKVPAAATKKLLEAAKQSYQKVGDGNGGGDDLPASSGLTGGVSKLAMQNAARTHARQLRMQQQAEEEAAGGGGRGGSSKNELVLVLEEQRQKHRYIDQILQKRKGKALKAVAPHVVARVAPAAAAMTRRIQVADAGRELRATLAAMHEAEEKAEEVLSQEDADYYWSDAE